MYLLLLFHHFLNNSFKPLHEYYVWASPYVIFTIKSSPSYKISPQGRFSISIVSFSTSSAIIGVVIHIPVTVESKIPPKYIFFSFYLLSLKTNHSKLLNTNKEQYPRYPPSIESNIHCYQIYKIYHLYLM